MTCLNRPFSPSNESRVRLSLHDLRLRGPHGVYADERSAGNEFSVDLTLEGDFSDALARDCLQASVDFDVVAKLVEDVHRQQQFHLIESFADAISRRLMDQFSTLSRVSVKVSKLTLIRLESVQSASAEVVRERA